MKTSFRPVMMGSVLSLSIFSCVEHNIPVVGVCMNPTTTISYSADVNDIVDTVCAVPGCHNGDNGADKNWTEFPKFQAHAAEVSRRITLPDAHPDHMPREGSLTDNQIQTIVCWVEQGAQAN